MKLSQAIREGAKIRPQAFGGLYDGIGSCAMGAAYEYVFGFGFYPRDLHIFDYEETIANYDCPKCPVFPYEYPCLLIAHLNDYHKWSRQRIADFVESIEIELDKLIEDKKDEVKIDIEPVVSASKELTCV